MPLRWVRLKPLICRVAVGVAAAGLHGVGTRVGTPLDHAEGEVRAGELADGARADGSGGGAVERMDEGRRVGDGGRRRGGVRRGRGGHGDGAAAASAAHTTPAATRTVASPVERRVRAGSCR